MSSTSDTTVRPGGSDTTTEGLRVVAEAQWLESESDPERRHWLYAYRIVLSNEGERRARLVARHWIIVDSEGKRNDVRGPGVVGEHPNLAHRESYSYVSYCPLSTPWGTMEGSYTFERDDGQAFEARIARFFLAPHKPVAARR